MESGRSILIENLRRKLTSYWMCTLLRCKEKSREKNMITVEIHNILTVNDSTLIPRTAHSRIIFTLRTFDARDN